MAKSNKTSTLVIEANGIAWAAYSAVFLSTKSGEGTGAIFGTLKSIRSLIDRFSPDIAFVCFDKTRNARRLKLYPDYKSKEQKFKTEEEREEFRLYRSECKRQIDCLPEMLMCLGVPVVRVADLESDDVVAAIASVWKEDTDITIVSNDKDFLQLIGDNVRVFNHIHDRMIDKDNFEEQVKALMKIDIPVPLDSWNLFRVLVGDSSDNIPGIRGCGAKKGAKLVQGCTTIEELLEKVKTDKTKLAQTISQSEETMRLWEEIMDLRDICNRKEDMQLISDELGKLDVRVDHKRFFELCKQYEFDSIYTNFTSWVSPFKQLGRSV